MKKPEEETNWREKKRKKKISCGEERVRGGAVGGENRRERITMTPMYGGVMVKPITWYSMPPFSLPRASFGRQW